MEVIKLMPGGLTEPGIARPYKCAANGKLYYNIVNGTSETGFNKYVIYLREKDFRDLSNLNKSSILLDRKDYVIKPVYLGNTVAKDESGNVKYNLHLNKFDSVYKTSLVIWEIPNFHYEDVKFEVISGNVEVLGQGTNGINRDGRAYTSPAPILEVEGDVTISWSGKDRRGNMVGEVLTRVNNEWTSSPIKQGE